MSKVYEEISKSNAQSSGKTDANLANDSNHLGGIPAEQYATKEYVKNYHGSKEDLQKEYIDEQDKKVLNEAKEYTNAQLRNQDFSSFAKVSDVQALETKLQSKIVEGNQAQKVYTDGKIQAVVQDVNANFVDVNNAIGSLNNTTKELFQSVSNGKSVVAEAITDKGIVTSATDTFTTMAGNIRNISTGGGSIDPNFVNTSDATATASDILVGKMAYGQGNKIYGTLITRTEEGAPSYGTDTSNATATSSDIVYGKTAYARGQLLTGTLKNSEVEEFYGIKSNAYVNKSLIVMDTDPITGDSIFIREQLQFSENGDYCVSLTKLNNSDSAFYIESYALNDKGMYIQQSSNLAGDIVTKKYRYTLSELGIGQDEIIEDIRLGKNGLFGDARKCLLSILTKTKKVNAENNASYDITLYLFTYHVSENGTIGKMYENEDVLNIKKVVVSDSSYESLRPRCVMFHTICEDFLLFYAENGAYNVRNYSVTTNNQVILNHAVSKNIYTSSSSEMIGEEIHVSTDDRFVTFNSTKQSSFYNIRGVLIWNDTSTRPYYPIISYKDYVNSNVHNTNYFICTELKQELILFEVSRSGNDLARLNLKTIHVPKESTKSTSIYNLQITPDNRKVIVLRAYIDYSVYKTLNHKLEIYDLDTLFSLQDGDLIEPEQQFVLDTNNSNSFGYSMFIDKNGSQVLLFQRKDEIYCPYNFLRKVLMELDTSCITAIKYKDQYFYTVKAQNLTAGQGDVRLGKTFLGWQGYPETGTMEV